MWVIVVFVDEVIAAVPISWIINSNGNKYCVWPLQDERQKRSKSEIPPSLLTDDWELHECVILLDGAIYDSFEDALGIEMGCIDIGEVNTHGFPKLSWKEDENDNISSITENAKTTNQDESSVLEDFQEFKELLNRPDLCSTQYINEHDQRKMVETFASVTKTERKDLPTIQIRSEMLDTILKNQEEKKKILVKLMARMYFLESAVGCKSS